MAGPGASPAKGKPREGRTGGSLRRAFIGAALATCIPFLLLIAYLAWSQVSREHDRIAREALAQATLLSAQVEKHFGARLEALTGAASLLGAGGASPSATEAHGRRLRQAFPDIDRAVLLDELGVAVASVPPLAEGKRLAVGDQEWFKRAATSTEPFIGVPWRAGQEVLVGIYAPVRTPEGQLRGVLALDLLLKRVQDLLAQAKLSAGTSATLVTDQGIVVARQPSLFLMANVGSLAAYADLLARGGTGEAIFEDGGSRIAGAVRLRPQGWTLVVGVPSAEVTRETQSHLLLVGGAALALTALAIVAGLRMASRQTEGFGRLRQAMVRLESGDLPATLPVTVGGEAGALTDSFNRMLSWLRGKLREYEVVSQLDDAAGRVATGDRSIDAMLPGLLRRVVGGVGADVGVLVLPDESGLTARAAVGFHGTRVEGTQLRRGQGLAGAVMSARESLIVTDVEADYRVEEPYLKDGAIRSIAALPLVAGDDLLGVVSVGYRAPHTFAADEVGRLEAIVRRTAQAIDRAQALDSVQRSTQGLEAQIAQQEEALQKAAVDQAEANRQTQEARKQARELEQRMKLQAAQAPQVKEVIVEREVVRADPAAEQATRLRGEMQKTVSEELRAPLTALLDLPRLLVDGLQKPLGDTERGQLEILQERGQEILELIEGLTTLSVLQAGGLKLTKAATDLPALVHRVVRALQPRVAAKGNRIETDIKPGVVPVVTDARRLEQVLGNLILSAVKYTEVGEIRVTCYLRDRDVVLTVADDGVGFTPEEQARIFRPFCPVGPRDGRKLPGTGLLLTVAERLVMALGGKIKMESEPDRGSWATVTLPVQG
ncbi:MAG TPA: ATP-binding protein [Methylomirabilota bacterium]|jgi:signal transduction histidine kinase|nr:ATP-binding protein [Methylomirabilota bacterium]